MRFVAAFALAAAGCGRINFDSGVPADASDGDGDSSVLIDAAPGCGAKLGGGQRHMCAINAARELYCWGENDQGQIGDGTAGTDRPVPTRVTGVGPVIGVAGGRFETCAAQANGTVMCWGEGAAGQLGNGMNLGSPVPVPVSTITQVTDVAASSIHACALDASGEVHCWGDGADGRLGIGSTMSKNTPQNLTTLPPIDKLSSGGSTSCAIAQTSRELWCWGYNQSGEVGDGTTAVTLVPVRNLLSQALFVSQRDNTGCAVLLDRRAFCWGRGDRGQLGNGSSGSSPSPVMVTNLVNVAELAAGIDHFCAARLNGTVACWGDNSFGQLGPTGPVSSNVPIDVPGLTNITTIASTGYTTCAATADGELSCWGRGADGELGNNTTAGSATPVSVVDLCP